jgi:hypothetical protein
MTKSSSRPATPRNTTTPRKCNLKIRTAIKCGVASDDGGSQEVFTNPIFEQP